MKIVLAFCYERSRCSIDRSKGSNWVRLYALQSSEEQTRAHADTPQQVLYPSRI